ncbi:hypothetical protein CLV56_0235 [Mumia flava]|uniref:Cell division protein FtsB n=1 Tax=Mumia flava TaxID=1348852 RepID=A0A2M9BDI9_9ACTN|nr:hypothetical protein [Mumia flava]PJJ56031.1 hypothetical protein CLV56_0235 [Mumia flava]
MSIVNPVRRAGTAPRPGPRNPLRAVPDRVQRTPRTPFVLLVVSLLAGGLVGLLLLNTSMQDSAFELATLEDKAEALQSRRAELTMEVEKRETPQALARRASKLGMVPNESPVFLRLSDGTVVGDPEPASADGPPSGLGGPSPAEVGARG